MILFTLQKSYRKFYYSRILFNRLRTVAFNVVLPCYTMLPESQILASYRCSLCSLRQTGQRIESHKHHVRRPKLFVFGDRSSELGVGGGAPSSQFRGFSGFVFPLNSCLIPSNLISPYKWQVDQQFFGIRSYLGDDNTLELSGTGVSLYTWRG